ncbi:MAG: hypothetical protein WKG03_20240 [Telluria sp.]
MATILGSLQEKDTAAERAPDAAAHLRTRQSLPAKGSCWYCDKTLDSVRRFCGKECADAFDEEAAYTVDAIANPPD